MPRKDKIDQVLTQLAVMEERQANMEKDTNLLPKVMEKLNRHDQTLYGISGKNGLVGNNKILMKAFWGAQAILISGGTALSIFKDQVMDFLLNRGAK